MYTNHTHCRACGYAAPGANGIKFQPKDHLIEVMDLGIQPLANDFQNGTGEHSGFAPLKVMFCPNCSLAQLSVVVRPDILYSYYSYVTSTSEMMKAHFENLWSDLTKEHTIKGVVEIGSNTGDFLAFCRQHGAERVIGIDPAENLAEIAKSKDIPVIVGGFDWNSAVEAHSRIMGSDLVVARHVFCHVDDWKDFVLNLKEIGDAETLYAIEVPYAPDMMAMNSWDQCLPPGQKIVTESGFEEIQNVKLGQNVLTHLGNFKPVTNVFSNSYSGEVIEITAYGQNTPLVVTPEHPVYVSRGVEFKFIEAKSIRSGDRLLKPCINGRSDKTVLSVIYPDGRSNTPPKTDFHINESLCKIMGFYLAEGYYYECKRGSAQVEFAFGKSELEKMLADECSDALKSFGAKGVVKLTKYGWHVITYGHMARLLHREIGTGAANKKVPAWMIFESDSHIETFIWAYIRGDGYLYRDGRYWRATTVSEELAQGIALLANKLGFTVSINIGKPLGIRRIHKNPSWSILTKPPIDILIRTAPCKKIKAYCDGQYQYGLVRKVTRKPYTGTVHNIEVDGDSSYVCVQGAVHNCYHEHLSYLTLKSVVALLKDTGLHLHGVNHYPIHGGAIVLLIRRDISGIAPRKDLSAQIDVEHVTRETWLGFAYRARNQQTKLKSTIEVALAQKKTVAGLGASAKSTVWINACGLTRKHIAFIADNTPQKQYTFSPGSDIPILDEGAILRELPDYVVMFAWNYRNEVLKKFELARHKGVKFIVPVPEIEVV